MALPSSGAIALLDLQNEFGGSNPISMSEYYRDGGLVPSNNSSVPTSGQISLSQFYGAVNEILITVGNATNVSLSSQFGSGTWGSSVPKRARLTGTIGSSNGSAALTINGGMGGNLIIENSGSIQGTSGAANSGGGGTAVYCDPNSSSRVTFNNTGTVYAGGGGGGRGGNGGTGGGGYYNYTVWTDVGSGTSGDSCTGYPGYDASRDCTSRYGGGTRCGGNVDYNYCRDDRANCDYNYDFYYDDSDEDAFKDCATYNDVWCKNCQQQRTITVNTNGGGGGSGGSGGRGQGYGVSAQSGSGGSNGAGGGSNAGTGGKGGTGGSGGGWGASGATGATGNTGGSGNRTGGSGGSSGSGGGAAGYYIQNRSGMAINNSGGLAGR